MRKIVLGVAVSLDGYIEGPKGEIDWCFTDQDYGMSSFLKRIDGILMGRKSWELSLTMGGNPWKGVTTYVFSNSLKTLDAPDVKLVSGKLVPSVSEIRKSKGKDLWLFGGGELISAFVNEDLVDEYWLSVHPVVLGGGKPLFGNIKKRLDLKLQTEKSYDTGLVSLTYGRVKNEE